MVSFLSPSYGFGAFEALRWLDQFLQGGNDDGAIDRADACLNA
jgi:hypothetical protein